MVGGVVVVTGVVVMGGLVVVMGEKAGEGVKNIVIGVGEEGGDV